MPSKRNNNSPFIYSTNPDFIAPGAPGEDIEENVSVAQQKIKVMLQTKNRGGKAVTIIANFKGTVAEEEELGKKLKSFCGTGGSVKDGEIMVQGDNRDKVLQWLHKNGFAAAKKI